MNNSKSSGFLGLLKMIFGGIPEESTAGKPAVNKAGASRKEWKPSAQQTNVQPVFTAGRIVAATVKRVDKTVAYFTVQGASSAIVTAKACAKGGSVTFDDLAVGQRVRVRVKSWYPQTRQLILAGVEKIAWSGRKDKITISRKSNTSNRTPKTVKPDYRPLPAGAVVLVDGANLLGKFEPNEAMAVFRSLTDGLKAQGHDVRIFLEHRAWKFYGYNQASEVAGEKFKALCRELDVTIVMREADLAILQTLDSVPNSVAVTNDRYVDYAKTFPELVGTLRLRGFSVTRIDDRKLISVDGLIKAVTVVEPVDEMVQVREEAVGESVSEESVLEQPQVERTFTRNMTRGFCGYGSVLLAKGNVRGAIRCFEKGVARNQVEGYSGLAEVCLYNGDAKSAKRYERLGEKLAHRLREREIRNRRIAAERHRIGSDCYAKCA